MSQFQQYGAKIAALGSNKGPFVYYVPERGGGFGGGGGGAIFEKG